MVVGSPDFFYPKNYKFETLKWLRIKRCPWNVNVIYAALERGNMEMFIWCINNDCFCLFTRRCQYHQVTKTECIHKKL